MSIKKWTDEELTSTRDKLEAWNVAHKSKGWGPRLWLLTALMGAFAISTGVVFMFFDGIDTLSVILIVLGCVTCFSWYQSEKKKKEAITFLAEVNDEIARRERREAKSTPAKKTDKKGAAKENISKAATDKKDTEKESRIEEGESKQREPSE